MAGIIGVPGRLQLEWVAAFTRNPGRLRWGTQCRPSTVSDLNKKIDETIETWRNPPIEGQHPYVHLDGIVMKRSWASEVRNVSLLARHSQDLR